MTMSIKINFKFKFYNISSSESHTTQHINPDNRDTLITFAELAQASYDRKAMSIVDSDGLSIFQGIGWDQVGIRGYIWTDNLKENVVVVFKGTSVSFPGSASDTIPTTSEDRIQVFSHLSSKPIF